MALGNLTVAVDLAAAPGLGVDWDEGFCELLTLVCGCSGVAVGTEVAMAVAVLQPSLVGAGATPDAHTAPADASP